MPPASSAPAHVAAAAAMDLSRFGQTAPAAASPAGWTVDLVEVLMADYKLTLREAVRFPLSAARPLLAARSHRLGHDGPTSADKAEGRARARAWAWLTSHFTILPDAEYLALADGMTRGPCGVAPEPGKS